MISASTTQPIAATISPRYLALIQQYPLRPIRSDADLDRAIGMADLLIDLKTLTHDDTDYLEVLGGLIHQYEHANEPIPRGTNADLLGYLIENKGVSQVQLAREVGVGEPTIVAILAGERGVESSLALSLARYFHVNPSLFLES